MSSTYTATASYTYSTVDVENVMRNFSTDLRMIVESSNARSDSDIDLIVQDIAYFAKRKYVRYIDVTLLDGQEELRAAHYVVNEKSGEFEPSRPGGVLWPRVVNGRIRIVVGWTAKYADDPPDRSRLKLPWGPSCEDISHTSLTSSAGRNFTSSSYGLQRTDYTA